MPDHNKQPDMERRKKLVQILVEMNPAIVVDEDWAEPAEAAVFKLEDLIETECIKARRGELELLVQNMKDNYGTMYYEHMLIDHECEYANRRIAQLNSTSTPSEEGA